MNAGMMTEASLDRSAERLLDVLGQVEDRYIEEAVFVEKKRVFRHQLKLFAAAACFLFAVMLGFAAWQNDLFSGAHTVILDDGETITFEKAGSAATGTVHLPGGDARDLTAEEAEWLLGNVDVDGALYGLFDKDHKLRSFEGWIGDAPVRVSASDMDLMYVETEPGQETHIINDVPVLAGYTIQEGVKGEKIIGYYALFKLGDVTVFLEKYGEKTGGRTDREAVAAMADLLTERGAVDLQAVQERTE